MTVYHGNASEKLEIHSWKKSRYGFPALFFSTSLELAQLYAIHHSKRGIDGYVHKAEIAAPMKTIDYHGDQSYSIEFRQLMFKLRSQKLPSVEIINIMDSPTRDILQPIISNIIVVFDFKEIYSIKTHSKLIFNPNYI